MDVPSEELYPGDIKSVLLSADQIQAKVAELGVLGADYRDTIAETTRICC